MKKRLFIVQSWSWTVRGLLVRWSAVHRAATKWTPRYQIMWQSTYDRYPSNTPAPTCVDWWAMDLTLPCPAAYTSNIWTTFFRVDTCGDIGWLVWVSLIMICISTGICTHKVCCKLGPVHTIIPRDVLFCQERRSQIIVVLLSGQKKLKRRGTTRRRPQLSSSYLL